MQTATASPPTTTGKRNDHDKPFLLVMAREPGRTPPEALLRLATAPGRTETISLANHCSGAQYQVAQREFNRVFPNYYKIARALLASAKRLTRGLELIFASRLSSLTTSSDVATPSTIPCACAALAPNTRPWLTPSRTWAIGTPRPRATALVKLA